MYDKWLKNNKGELKNPLCYMENTMSRFFSLEEIESRV